MASCIQGLIAVTRDIKAIISSFITPAAVGKGYDLRGMPREARVRSPIRDVLYYVNSA